MLTALRSRDFRLLWTAQSVSLMGDALVLVAVGLYVTELTGDPSDVGRVLTAYALPLVLFVLVGGVVADRLPRTRVMVASDLVRCVLHGTVAVLIATGAVRVWHLVVVGVLFGTAEAFFRPAYTGLVPQTVPEGDIQRAQALSGVAAQVAELVGPALATALVLGVGGGWAFGVDAATFALSAVLVGRVRARDRGVRTAATGVLVELREGWAAVRERAWVWACIAGFSSSLLVALAPFYVLGADVARAAYGTAAVYGFANAAWAVGTVGGAVLGAWWRPALPMRSGLMVGAWWPLCVAVYGLEPPVGVLCAAMAAAGFGLGLFGVWWETALAQRIPPHLLSRVSAWDWMGSMALLPLGYLLAGPLAARFGAREVLVVGGVLGALAMASALLPPSVRALPRLEEPAGPPRLAASAG